MGLEITHIQEFLLERDRSTSVLTLLSLSLSPVQVNLNSQKYFTVYIIILNIIQNSLTRIENNFNRQLFSISPLRSKLCSSLNAIIKQ